VIVREERPEDRDAVRRVEEAAFGRPDEADIVDAKSPPIATWSGASPIFRMPPRPSVRAASVSRATHETASATADAFTLPTTRPSCEFSGACVTTRPPTTARPRRRRLCPLVVPPVGQGAAGDHYLASSQFGPEPASTFSGGSRSAAAIISREITSAARSVSSAGPSASSSSWI
jgi:hypothetical protein